MILFFKNLFLGQSKHHLLMVCALLWVFSQVGAAFAMTDPVKEDAGFEGGNVRSIPREPDPETHLPVRDRSFPEFQAKGILLGRLRVLPSIGVQSIYRDNLFATQNNKIDDLAIVTSPAIEAHTEDERHFFSANLQTNIARYVENDSEDYEDYNLSSLGYFEIKQELLLPWSVSYKQYRQDREDNLSRLFTAEPLSISETKFDLGFLYKPNRLSLKVLGRHIQKRFEDGQSLQDPTLRIVRSDSNFNANEIEAEVGYEFMTNHVGFVRGVAGQTKYETNIFDDNAGVFTNRFRDNRSLKFLAGVKTDYKGLLFSDIGVGYASTDFEDSSFTDIDNLAIEAEIDWNVTKLSTLGLDLMRTSVQDNEIIQGYVNTRGQLSVGS